MFEIWNYKSTLLPYTTVISNSKFPPYATVNWQFTVSNCSKMTVAYVGNFELEISFVTVHTTVISNSKSPSYATVNWQFTVSNSSRMMVTYVGNFQYTYPSSASTIINLRILPLLLDLSLLHARTFYIH